MQTQALPALASGASTSVSFNVPLREAGTFVTKIVVEGTVTAEATANIVVAQETPSGSKQVGTVTTTGTNVPARLNYRNSDSEIIYTQDVIDWQKAQPSRVLRSRATNRRKNCRCRSKCGWRTPPTPHPMPPHLTQPRK